VQLEFLFYICGVKPGTLTLTDEMAERNAKSGQNHLLPILFHQMFSNVANNNIIILGKLSLGCGGL
jgi:hypothetical protein